MNYRRAFASGGTFFFTAVTFERRPILLDPPVLQSLRAAFATVRRRQRFSLDAIVVLPDHLHCIWQLPDGDHDFSIRWAAIKAHVSRTFGDEFDAHRPPSRAGKRERTVWQRRFWEHTVRTEAELAAHRDYVHFNPVKHGLASTPAEWRASSFHRFVRQGLYPPSWSRDPGLHAPE